MGGAIPPRAGGQARIQPERVPGQAHTPDVELIGVLHEDAKDGGMQMQMLVAVYMVEREAGAVKSFKLGVYFAAQLLVQFASEEITPTDGSRPVFEFSPGI